MGLFCVSLVRCHRSARLRTPSIIVPGGRVADRHFALPPVLSLPTPVLSLQLTLRPHPQFPTPTFLRLKSPTFLRLSPDRCRCCARLSGRASNRGELRRGAGSLGGVGFGRRPFSGIPGYGIMIVDVRDSTPKQKKGSVPPGQLPRFGRAAYFPLACARIVSEDEVRQPWRRSGNLDAIPQSIRSCWQKRLHGTDGSLNLNKKNRHLTGG